MKKIIFVFLCSIMIFAFTACGSKKSETSCYNCNKVIHTEDTYCKYCGAKVFDDSNENNKATASVMITTTDFNDTTVTNKDIQNSISLAYTYIDLFQLHTTLEKVQENLDFFISTSELKKSIQFNLQSENSNILQITVFADTKENADKILSCVLNESPDIMKNLVSNSKFIIVSID